jgi:hypothetical protein
LKQIKRGIYGRMNKIASLYAFLHTSAEKRKSDGPHIFWSLFLISLHIQTREMPLFLLNSLALISLASISLKTNRPVIKF